MLFILVARYRGLQNGKVPFDLIVGHVSTIARPGMVSVSEPASSFVKLLAIAFVNPATVYRTSSILPDMVSCKGDFVLLCC